MVDSKSTVIKSYKVSDKDKEYNKEQNGIFLQHLGGQNFLDIRKARIEQQIANGERRRAAPPGNLAQMLNLGGGGGMAQPMSVPMMGNQQPTGGGVFAGISAGVESKQVELGHVGISVGQVQPVFAQQPAMAQQPMPAAAGGGVFAGLGQNQPQAVAMPQVQVVQQPIAANPLAAQPAAGGGVLFNALG